MVTLLEPAKKRDRLTMGELSNGPHPQLTTPPYTQTGGFEKSPFQISANPLKIDENVTGTQSRTTHWLVVK